QIYVTRSPTETPTGRYLGTCHFQRMLREPPGTLVSAIVDANLVPIGPQAPLGEVTRTFAAYNLVALPVVDEHQRLLGAVTVDDVIDHMLPADWRNSEGADVDG
ncbi:MAG: CBS domain-containing protein, partial [Actinomycetales bacterium]